MVLHILTFTFLDSRRDDKRLWTEWQQAFPEFSLLLILHTFEVMYQQMEEHVRMWKPQSKRPEELLLN
jgi:hypothetical protein